MRPRPRRPTHFPYTTLFRSNEVTVAMEPKPLIHAARGDIRLTNVQNNGGNTVRNGVLHHGARDDGAQPPTPAIAASVDRKSTRLNSSHLGISYAVFCLKKKK